MADSPPSTATARPRPSLIRRVFITGVAVLAIVGVYWAVRSFFIDDPDDRPPIIVNNGSIIFEPENRPHLPGTPPATVRGQWKEDVTTPKWRHSHGGKQPTYLTVDSIVNSTTCDGSSYNASAIALSYGDGTNEGSGTLTIEASGMKFPPFFSRHLKIDFHGATPSLNANGYTLTLPNKTADRPIKIRSIAITLWPPPDPTPPNPPVPTTCAFADTGDSTFRVQQRK